MTTSFLSSFFVLILQVSFGYLFHIEAQEQAEQEKQRANDEKQRADSAEQALALEQQKATQLAENLCVFLK